MFSYLQSIKQIFAKSQSFETDNYNVKIDIIDENTFTQSLSNNINTYDFYDIEAGKTSVKSLFTNDEWEQVTKVYAKSSNKKQIITQLFNEVNKRRKVLQHFDI